MDLSDFTASGRITIDAPPEVLFDFIADMPAMGEISPQCTGGEWRSDARGVGALFVGSNAIAERTWQAQMRVLVADRPREFAWENMGAVDWVDADLSSGGGTPSRPPRTGRSWKRPGASSRSTTH